MHDEEARRHGDRTGGGRKVEAVFFFFFFFFFPMQDKGGNLNKGMEPPGMGSQKE
jgi:hypothetical protein